MNIPWELQGAVHGIHEVLSERGEQERAVVFYPKVTALAHKLFYPVFAFFQVIRRLQMLCFVPVAVRASLDGLCYGAVIVDAEEEIDGCLLVGVCGASSSELSLR